jgi:hypothetical protein
MVVSMSKVDAENDYGELKSFVTGTLTAIMEGIKDAQSTVKMDSAHGTGVYKYNAPTEVAFDVAISAERVGGAKGGFEIKILSVGANAGAEATSKNSTASRIQFSVRTEFKSNRRARAAQGLYAELDS